MNLIKSHIEPCYCARSLSRAREPTQSQTFSGIDIHTDYTISEKRGAYYASDIIQ